VLTARFRASGACEPRQVREEAALSSLSRVPRGNLARASAAGTASRATFDERCVTAEMSGRAERQTDPQGVSRRTSVQDDGYIWGTESSHPLDGGSSR
jgi:hypothetical protein